MKLTNGQIKEITVGAVEIWEESDGLHFGKCTKSQIEQWRSINEVFANNATSTTGVRLDFHEFNFYLIYIFSKG